MASLILEWVPLILEYNMLLFDVIVTVEVLLKADSLGVLSKLYLFSSHYVAHVS